MGRKIVRWVKQGRSQRQHEMFKRAIEEAKTGVGGGGDFPLSKEELMDIRDVILKGFK